MMSEHMKAVAERHANDEQKQFFKYLTACGWKLIDIESMWEYANRQNERNKENG